MRQQVCRCIVICVMIGGILFQSRSFLDPARTTPRSNIFFLKTHKCASSTVQNVLMRFGLQRGLTFALPEVGQYLGHPEPFRADMIGRGTTTADGKYNIFAHHCRYNAEEARAVMYEDAVFVTILRHPAQVYESTFSYYEFQEEFNVTFKTLLSSPESVNKITHRLKNRFGFNQMSFDLGFPVEDFNSTVKVAEFVDKIDAEFDLVMMAEWMDESLVLLADLMNWPLKNVTSLKLNARLPRAVYNLTEAEKTRLVELNSVDYALYAHFLKKFQQRVRDYGKSKMKSYTEKLLVFNSNLKSQCVKSVNGLGHQRTQSYELRDMNDLLCVYSTKLEIPFTKDLRNFQRKRVQVVKRNQ